MKLGTGTNEGRANQITEPSRWLVTQLCFSLSEIQRLSPALAYQLLRSCDMQQPLVRWDQ
jgi:hypothetical protein